MNIVNYNETSSTTILTGFKDIIMSVKTKACTGHLFGNVYFCFFFVVV